MSQVYVIRRAGAENTGAGIRTATALNLYNTLQTLSFPRVATTFWSLYSISLYAPKVWLHTQPGSGQSERNGI